ncbi:hypothetical protein JTE90_002349 [Oedothorax gibbosus]|uniref:Uncharacterized protein n=1 Tax=Oedothorax gibbosus TaxID=931172 RepID=A0AAV6UK51_9ARAC|nr:hypothetical protein JTE90_002349 [Oedothorax gibbosus]
MHHDGRAVWGHLLPVLQMIQKTWPHINTIHFHSDGPTTQYRNKTNLFLLTCFANKLGLKEVTWNFSEAGHGKSSADGVGGQLKTKADQFVAHGTDIPDAFYTTFLRWLQTTEEIEKGTGEASENKPNLDLGFKEGQTITINMNISKKSSKPRPKSTSAGFSGTPGLLPPPPGGVKLPPPSTSKTATQSNPAKPTNGASSIPSVTNDLLDLGSLSLSSVEPALNPAPASQNSSSNELWGDFTTAGNLDSEKKTSVNSDDWINF